MPDDEKRLRPRSGGRRIIGKLVPKAKPAVAPKPEDEAEFKPPNKKKTGEGDK